MKNTCVTPYIILSVAVFVAVFSGISFAEEASVPGANQLPVVSDVTGAQVNIDQAANVMTITAQSASSVLNFSSFNIGSNASVNIVMPTSDSTMLNRVTGDSISSIFGAINANQGLWVLVNTNGIYFSPTAVVNVDNMIASTLDISTNNFLAGNYIFEHQGTSYAQLLNEGSITGNNIALMGSAVENTGIIVARAGSVHLASGDKTTVSFDRRGLISIEVNEQTSGEVIDLNGNTVEDALSNSGNVQGVTVVMTAQTANNIFKNAVNLSGVVKATQIVEEEGAIRIVSNKNINVSAEFKTEGNTILSANEDINVNGNLTVTNGNLDLLADSDLDGVGSFYQAQDTTISTINYGDITIQSSGASTLANINSAGSLILKQAGAPVTYTQHPNSTITTYGSLTINPGVTLNAANSSYNIGKDWTNQGAFNPQTSTVSLTSSQDALVQGNNVFYNFTITEPGKIVKFESESTQAILNNLTFRGEYGNLLTITSIDPSKQWSINPLGQTDIQYSLISNLNNIRGPPLKALHTSSLGNNTNLDLDPFWTGNGPTSNWSDPDNWDTGTIPTAFDTVTFDGVTGSNPNKNSLVDPAFAGTIDNLIINGYTGTLTLGRDLTISGNLNLQTGAFDPSTYTVTFTDASKPSYISGNITFYNFTCVTPDKELYFQAGKTYTFTNSITLTGAVDQGAEEYYIKLRSQTPGSQYYLNVQSTYSLERVNVSDAYAVTALDIPIGVNAGNNTNITIDPTWDNGGGDGLWSTAANWDGNVVPSTTDAVTFDGTSTANCTIDNIGTWSGGTLTITSAYTGTINVAVAGISVTSLSLAGGTIILASADLAIAASGTYTQSGGTFDETVDIDGNNPFVLTEGAGATWAQTGGTFRDYGSTHTATPPAYRVATEANLQAVMNNLGYSYVQTANITLTADFKSYIVGDATTKFTGTYNGAGYTIASLTIDTSVSADEQYVGLFGYTSAATLENIGLTGVTINTSYTADNSYVGALVGYNLNTAITNCYSTGSITTSSTNQNTRAGGLVGFNYASGANSAVSSSYSTASVTSTTTSGATGPIAGGLVGYNYAGTAHTASITNSYATGDVSVTSTSSTANSYDFAGGLVGYNVSAFSGGTASISNSYATGSVSSTVTNFAASAASYTGGLIGNNYGAVAGSIVSVTNSYATGAVSIVSNGTTTNPHHYAGGLIGQNLALYTGTTNTVSGSFATGNVSVNQSGTAYPRVRAGGLIGTNYVVYNDASITVTNSYATGTVTATTITSTCYAGGLIGENRSDSASTSITISNSFATGSATATTTGSSNTGAGGFAGYTLETAGTITIQNVFATGVGSASGGANNYAGGLVGIGSGLTVTNCKWFNGTNTDGIGTPADGTAKKASALSDLYDVTAAPLSSWTFDASNWSNALSTKTYPYLSWSDLISGTSYASNGGAEVNNLTVNLIINGRLIGIDNTTNHGAGFNSTYYIPAGYLSNNQSALVYIDGSGSYSGNTATVSAASDISSLHIYGDTTLALTYANGSSITNANLNTAKGSYSDSDIIYSVSGSDLTVTGSLLILTGKTFAPGANVTVSGSWKNSGTFTSGSNTATFNGSSTQTLDSGGSNFYNLTHSGSGTLQLSTSNLTVTNNLTNSAGTFDLNGLNWTMTGAAFSNTGTVQLKGTETITGLTQDTAKGTWTYVGDGTSDNITIKYFGATDYYNLSINDSGAPRNTFILGENLALASGGTLTVAASNTLALGTYSLTVVTTLSNSGTITVSTGAVTIPNAASGDFTFTGTNNIPIATYGTLTLNGSGATFTPSGAISAANLTLSAGTFAGGASNITVTSDFTLSGGTFTSSSGTFYVGGNWSHTGTAARAIFNHNNGTVDFNGSGTQTFGYGPDSFYNLTHTGSGTLVVSPNWTVQRGITIDAVGEAMTAFPVLVSTSSDSSLNTNAQADGDDIVFTDVNGVRLNHEIESYATGTLVAWVAVNIGTSATTIYMHYGNAAAANQSNAAGVWDSNFQGVWHMDTTSWDDTTGNNADGTSATYGGGTAPSITSGLIGSATTFSGASNAVGGYVTIANSAAQNFGTGDFTISFWVQMNVDQYGRNTYYINKYDGGAVAGWHMTYIASTNKFWIMEHDNDISGGFSLYSDDGKTLNNTSWHLLTYVRDTSGGGNPTRYMYFDGVAPASPDTSHVVYDVTQAAQPLIFGSRLGTTNFFNGIMDEVRLSDSVRSGNWLAAEYSNQNDPTNFAVVDASDTTRPLMVTNNFSNTGNLQLRGDETISVTGSTTHNVGSTVTYVGDADAGADTFTINNWAYKNLTINSADGTTDTFQPGASLDVNGNFRLQAGTFDCNSQTQAYAGNFQLDNGTIFTKGAAITFDGTTAATYTDSTATPQNIGTVTINKTDTVAPSTNNKLTLASSMTVDTLTIDGTAGSADTLDLGSGGYTLTLANAGATATVFTNSGTLTPGDSTVKYSATNSGGNINVTTTTYDNLQLSGAETYDLTGNLTSSNALTGNLTIDNGATLDAVSGSDYGLTAVNITINGTYTAQGSTITASGDWNSQNGTFTFGTSTVNLNGTSNTLYAPNTSAQRFYQLTIGTGAVITVNSTNGFAVQNALTINGSLSVPSGAVVHVPVAATFTMGASSTLTGAGILRRSIDDTGAATNINSAAAITITTFQYRVGTNSTTQQLGTIPNNATYQGNLEIYMTYTNPTARLAAGTLSVNGTLFLYNPYGQVDGTWFTVDANTNNANITCGGLVLGDDNTGNTHGVADEGVTLQMGSGTLTVNGNVQIFASDGGSNNNVLIAGSGAINVTGNWSNSETFTSNTSTVTFNGSSDQTITTNSQAFNNLILNNTGVSESDDIIISGTLDVNGLLTITNGDLDVSTNDPAVNIAGGMTVGASGSIDLTAYSGTWTFDGTGTLTDSRSTLGNLGTFTIDGSSATLTLGSNIKATAITIGANDTLNLGAGSYTLELTGSGTPLTVNGTFNKGTGSTVQYTGGDATTITAATYNHLEILPSANSATHTLASGTFSVNNLTLGNGTNTGVIITANTNDPDITVSGNLTIAANTTFQASNSAALNVAGNWANSGTFTANSGTVTLNGTGTQDITSNAQSFNDLTINKSSGSAVLQDALDVNGNLTISTGTLDANGKAIDISGNWANSGTFTPNSNTVTFDGAGTSILSGSTTFYNFTSATAGKTLTFTNGTTQTITNALTLTGTAGSPIIINNTGAGAVPALTLNSGATQSINNVNVTNNDASGGLQLVAGGTSTLSGTTTNWVLGSSGTTYTWTGTVSTDWNTPGNWDLGIVPSSTDTVVIPVTANQPTLAGATTLVGLTINSGETLSTGNNALTITNNLTLNGTLNAGTSSVTVNGNLTGSGTIGGTTLGIYADGYIGTQGNPLNTNVTGTLTLSAEGMQDNVSISVKGTGIYVFQGAIPGFIIVDNHYTNLGQSTIRGSLEQGTSNLYMPRFTQPMAMPLVGMSMLPMPMGFGAMPMPLPAVMPAPAIMPKFEGTTSGGLLPTVPTFEGTAPGAQLPAAITSRLKGITSTSSLPTVTSPEVFTGANTYAILPEVATQATFAGNTAQANLPEPLFQGITTSANLVVPVTLKEFKGIIAQTNLPQPIVPPKFEGITPTSSLPTVTSPEEFIGAGSRTTLPEVATQATFAGNTAQANLPEPLFRGITTSANLVVPVTLRDFKGSQAQTNLPQPIVPPKFEGITPTSSLPTVTSPEEFIGAGSRTTLPEVATQATFAGNTAQANLPEPLFRGITTSANLVVPVTLKEFKGTTVQANLPQPIVPPKFEGITPNVKIPTMQPLIIQEIIEGNKIELMFPGGKSLVPTYGKGIPFGVEAPVMETEIRLGGEEKEGR